jgi:hypothetical protein
MAREDLTLSPLTWKKNHLLFAMAQTVAKIAESLHVGWLEP